MNRIGISDKKELLETYNYLIDNKIDIEGIYTHIFNANNQYDTNKQINLFDNMLTDDMKKTKVDLTDIKSNDLDDTATFTDLMSKKERKNKNDDIEDMVNEKKRNTKDLTNDIKLAKEEIKKDKEKEIDNTKIIDI